MKTIRRLVMAATVVLGLTTLLAGRASSQTIPTSIILANPTNGQAFAAPASIYVHAQFTDSNLVKYVQYFSGNTTIGLATNGTGVLETNTSEGNSLYLTWSNVTAGTYTLTAVAHDSTGLAFTSAPVSISVTNPVVIPSVYIYSPTNGARFVPGTNVMLYARAVEGNTGTVATVQFFVGSVSLGVVSNSSVAVFTNISSEPLFPLLWTNVAQGGYALTARATDASGNTATSSVVNIDVEPASTNPPAAVPFSVSYSAPTNGQKFAATNLLTLRTAATDSNVIRTVQFFANGGSVGTATNAGNLLLTNLTQSNPFYLLWTNPPVGTNVLTALATDSLGNTATSGVVTITITNVPVTIVRPSVYIYSPTNGAKFTGPTNLMLYARAAESTGTVATVRFFANSVSLGVVSNSAQSVFTNISSEPLFPLLWSNAPAGAYSLTALATDLNGNSATSSVISITISTVTNTPPPTNVPFAVSFWYPTNGQAFAAPAAIGVHALATDSNVIRTVRYFANGGSIGIVSNTGSVLLTNASQESPFYLLWSNVPAGSYALTALATDSAGLTATSAVVNISVTNPPVTVTKPSVYIYSPANNSTSTAPANLNLYARAVESTGAIASVQFFANNVSLGTVPGGGPVTYTNVSSEPLYLLAWTNVPAGKYALTALATDTNGNTGTSSVVNITVVSPPIIPFAVSFYYPTNGQLFVTPATVGVHAKVTDSNTVETVSYFANGGLIGTVSNSPGAGLSNSTAEPFFLAWSNVTAGTYALTALALDSAGNTATSAPVTIFVLTNLPPAITIYATDPVAVQGTNAITSYNPGTMETNYVTGTNTATFLVRRSTSTNTDLTVDYSVGGTAINGYDYQTLPGSVVIPAGKTYALVTVWPLADVDTNYTYYDTVILTVLPPTNMVASTPPLPPTYTVGSPSSAGALILEADYLPLTGAQINSLADSTLHITLPATNGMNFTLETSPDMINWTPMLTNTVLKGSANFVDPNGAAAPAMYYRIVVAPTPASY